MCARRGKKSEEKNRIVEISIFVVCRVFDNEINAAVHASHAAYSNMLFKDALKTGTYDLQNARDVYRVACGPHGMLKDLAHRYIKVHTSFCLLKQTAQEQSSKSRVSPRFAPKGTTGSINRPKRKDQKAQKETAKGTRWKIKRHE